MRLKRRQFTREFKVQVVREIEAGKPVGQAARQHQIHPSLISRWQKEHREYGERAFAGHGNSYHDDARIAEMEQMIGQLTMDNAVLKKALRRLEERVHSINGHGGR